MPLIEVTYAAGTMSDQARDQLTSDLPQTLLRWEGAPDTDFFREITWTYLHEMPADRIAVNGRPADASMRVWVLVHEHPDGWWGAAGVSVQFTQLRRLAAEQRNSESQVEQQVL